MPFPQNFGRKRLRCVRAIGHQPFDSVPAFSTLLNFALLPLARLDVQRLHLLQLNDFVDFFRRQTRRVVGTPSLFDSTPVVIFVAAALDITPARHKLRTQRQDRYWLVIVDDVLTLLLHLGLPMGCLFRNKSSCTLSKLCSFN